MIKSSSTCYWIAHLPSKVSHFLLFVPCFRPTSFTVQFRTTNFPQSKTNPRNTNSQSTIWKVNKTHRALSLAVYETRRYWAKATCNTNYKIILRVHFWRACPHEEQQLWWGKTSTGTVGTVLLLCYIRMLIFFCRGRERSERYSVEKRLRLPTWCSVSSSGKLLRFDVSFREWSGQMLERLCIMWPAAETVACFFCFLESIFHFCSFVLNTGMINVKCFVS